MKKLLISIILLGAVVTAGGYVWYQTVKPVPQLPPKTEKVTKGKIIEKVSATGKIAPKDVVIVGIDVPAAKIAEVFKKCEVNNSVEEGQPLFRLDDTLAQARLKEAQSALSAAHAGKQSAIGKRATALVAVTRAELAETVAKRELQSALKVYELSDKQYLSQATLEKAKDAVELATSGVANAKAAVQEADSGISAAESVVKRAEAGVDVAEEGLKVMTIKSPINGIILERDKRVRAGQVVSAQMSPLLVIAPAPLQWELYVQVGEYDAHKIRKGMPVEFTVDAYSDDHSVHFKGTVSNIADLPTIQSKSADMPAGITGPTFYQVTVDVLPLEEKATSASEKSADTGDKQNKPHPLRAGLSTNVDFTIKEVGSDKVEEKKVLTVPNAALTYQPENLSSEEQKEINETTSQENNVGTVFLLVNGKEEKKVFVRKIATDGTRTAVEPLNDKNKGQKLEAGMDVITEPAPPPTSGGLFSRPLKGVGLN